MNKKISNKMAVIILISIIILCILYFVFVIVDLPTYIKNRDWLEEHGEKARVLQEQIQETNNEILKP